MFPTFTSMHPLRTLTRPPRPAFHGNSSTRRVSPDSVVGTAQELHHSDESDYDQIESISLGHAVDVLQLLDRSWFGPRPKSKGCTRSGRSKASPGSSPLLKPASENSTPNSSQQGATAQRPSPFLLQEAATAPRQANTGDSASSELPPQQAQRQSSAPVPTSLLKQPPEALAVQQLPGIGTWAGRQRLFARPVDLRTIVRTPSGGSPKMHPSLSPAEGDFENSLEETGRKLADAGETPDDGGILSGRSSVRSDQSREAAWRWRFTRKWEAEQKKYYDDAQLNNSLISNDELDAIEYTQACGMGVNLQFAGAALHRTSSRQSDHSSNLQHSLSCQFDVSGHGGSHALSALAAAAQEQHTPDGSQHPPRHSSSIKGLAPWLSPGLPDGAQQPSATKAVMSMVTKAHDLMQKQQQIEEEAQSRWEKSMNSGSDEPWAGLHLQPVQISMSGRFRFLVLRAVDSRGHQRYLVRGRSRATAAQLAEEAARETLSVCKRHGLPPVTIEAVGAGVMEWREDTDRHLHLSAASSSAESVNGGSSGVPPFSPKKGPVLGDVTGLAASLVRQALPCHFQITTTSAPSRMASLMDTLKI